ncbi:30S ribosomal protein S3 [Silvanigrella paludirubra]|uniref:Small ribosomal subunit protein uS3 n=1 Tax=Silvanigrella paludirubra TaxID=2499159 RepID=A0A6N6VRB7_9BACT|nr:30S ribosomal protein S3 [Silvanigrella paludirubra]KAB8037603.1 30S ribosomal protein S3 [Silvanigrella paludirubra]
MGQKVHPIGLRLGINKTWDSRWFSKREFAKNLNEDLNVRKFISKKYAEAGVARVEIERAAKQVVVKVYTAKPGKLIGKQGKGIELLRDEVKTVLKSNDKSIKVDVFEVKNPDTNAQLAAFNVAQQLEKRISFRRAMKKVMQQAMKAGGKGIKIRVAGRLNGAEMARTEWYMEGRVPLHTLRADIDYGTSEALTTYGLIGVKVWLFKGEVFGKTAGSVAPSSKNARNEE